MKNGMITDRAGNRWWYLDGILHRSDGPAIEYANGTRIWRVNGKLHRTDGPAYIDEYEWEWWLNDVEYTYHEWLEKNPAFDERTRLLWMIKNADKYT